jgi:hypothetical protein
LHLPRRCQQANLMLIKVPLVSLLLGLGGAFVNLSPLAAHEVEISNEVGGTLHIEPNDSPKAGTSSLAWFALARRGGQPIPLADCNCKLSVYAQPRSSGDAPTQQPTLSATSAEGRTGVPSANITFPRAGAYELVLQGSPVSTGAFSPFELRFAVTVAQ